MHTLKDEDNTDRIINNDSQETNVERVTVIHKKNSVEKEVEINRLQKISQRS